MSHLIQPSEAKELIANYKTFLPRILNDELPDTIMTRSETFNKADVMQMLQQTDCSAMRVYLGMDSSMNIRLVLVGVDSDNRDILEEGNEIVIEKGTRCPDDCPPSSAINS